MSSWTKREIILQALEEIGIHSYEYDSTAEDLQSALRQLNSMMGTWINDSIVFDPEYPLSTTIADTNIDADTNAPAEAIEPMYLSLAARLAPNYGKAASPDTKLNARIGFTGLLRNYVASDEYSLGRFLRGAGAKRPLYPFSNIIETLEEGATHRIVEDGDDRIIE